MSVSPTRLQTLLDAGEFVISAELTPSRCYDSVGFMTAATAIAPYVDVIQIDDNVLSQVGMASMVAEHLVKQEGLEPVLKFTLRHRNRTRLQSDLLEVASLGLCNLVILEDYSGSVDVDSAASDVVDSKALEAIASITRFTVSRSTAEAKPSDGDTAALCSNFYVGIIDFPACGCASDVEKAIDRIELKVNSGAKFIQVQATFDVLTIELWMAAMRARELHKRAHIIAAISVGGKQGSKPTLAMVDSIRKIEGFAGLHMRSVGFEDWVPQIVEAAGLRKVLV